MTTNESLFNFEKQSNVEILAKSGDGLQIELMKSLDDHDTQKIIQLSNTTVELYGDQYVLNPNTIRKSFNYPKTYPLIARLHKNPIAYIIGIPLEQFSKESWVKCDIHWGDGSTVYTQTEIVDPKFQNQNYIKILSKMYLNWLAKRGYSYVTGHQKAGVNGSVSTNAILVKNFENWQNSFHTFEYYRISL